MTHAVHSRPQPAAGAEIGSLIGGAFGLVFLIVNSAGFSTLGRTLVLIVGIAAFAAIAFLALRGLGRMKRAQAQTADSQVRTGGPFGRSYWIIVAIEAVALFGGIRLLSGMGHPELGVAWVAFVVGTHFYALGSVFKLGRFHILATVVTAVRHRRFHRLLRRCPRFHPRLRRNHPRFRAPRLRPVGARAARRSLRNF